MTITIRSEKGSSLSHNEMDENFTDLRDNPLGVHFPKTKGLGIKIDTTVPDFGWHDLIGVGYVDPAVPLTAPTMQIYRNTIKEFQFVENDEMFVRFHLPHDYLPNSDIFIHVHWSHASTTLTGGSCTWGFEYSYSKGHDQAAFMASKTLSIAATASTTQYQHIISETSMSITGGSATQVDSDILETDGAIICRLFFDSNDLTDSVAVPDPFVHFVDIHYQSTGIATKNKTPDFWT